MKLVNYSELGLQRWKMQRPKPSRIFLSPPPPQTSVPHHPPSVSVLPFWILRAVSFISSFLTFTFLALSPLPHSSFPSFRSRPDSTQFKQAPSTHNPSVSGAVRAQTSVLAFSPYTWQHHRATRLREVLLSLLTSKARWILRELKQGSFFLKYLLNLCKHFLNSLYPGQLQAISLLTDNVISKTKRDSW